MNKILRYTVMCFAAMLAASCDDVEPEYPDDLGLDGCGGRIDVYDPTTWYASHDLDIAFVDEEGNDLSYGITGGDEINDYFISVSNDAYTLVSTGDNNPPFVHTSFCGRLLNKYRYFNFDLHATYLNSCWNITHKLKCPHIFGDEIEHTIIARYVNTTPENYIIYNRKCVQFTLDGKEFPVQDKSRVIAVVERSKH